MTEEVLEYKLVTRDGKLEWADPILPHSNGEPNHPEYERGIKYDDGKERWDLLDFTQLGAVVRVITKGASKYGDQNWRMVRPFESRYFAAAMRHLAAYRTGQINDDETGEPHLAHAICNLLFLMTGAYNEHE